MRALEGMKRTDGGRNFYKVCLYAEDCRKRGSEIARKLTKVNHCNIIFISLNLNSMDVFQERKEKEAMERRHREDIDKQMRLQLNVLGEKTALIKTVITTFLIYKPALNV